MIGVGTTIVMPVMFYNRAYSDDIKHLNYDKRNHYLNEPKDDTENQKLLADGEMIIEEEGEEEKQDEPSREIKDNRRIFKIINWIVLISGVGIAIVGLEGSI